MGTFQSTPLETSCSTTNNEADSTNSIDHNNRVDPPNKISDEVDIFALDGNCCLRRQSTESLCASIGRSEDEIEENDYFLDEDWCERIHILEDAANLARLADFYLNPHKPLVPSDPYAYGRNYFTRPSAYKIQTMNVDEEEDDNMQCIIHSRAGERICENDASDTESRDDDKITHLRHETSSQAKNTAASLDPSCVVRFGLQYDHH